MAPGTRFLVEDIAREGCDDMEDIKCMKQVGPEELVAQARGKVENILKGSLGLIPLPLKFRFSKKAIKFETISRMI